MRVGTLNYATNQGLGILVKDFYDHGIVTDMVIVEHGSRESHHEWYPKGTPSLPVRRLDQKVLIELIEEVDVMLFFETPFNWNFIPLCKRLGTPSVIMPMYECMPRKLPAEPTWFFCPSLLDQQYFPKRSTFIPVPVDVLWNQRDKANHFVHNAGHLGLKGRNGTLELLQAIQHVRSPEFRITIRTQTGIGDLVATIPNLRGDERIEWFEGTLSYEDLWNTGDVFIFPEKFNGLSLPLQEARASGMLVIATDRFPMNRWLPQEPLIPVARTRKQSVGGSCVDFDEAVIHPKAIASTIDDWCGKDITSYSSSGKTWAETMSWETLMPIYQEALAKLL